MARRRLQSATQLTVPVDPVARALRLRRRGEQRRAMLALRQLCNVNGENARFWALYGAQCERAGRRKDAFDAYSQALWLRERERDIPRADALRRVIERVRPSAA